jgi:hypothetical protein
VVVISKPGSKPRTIKGFGDYESAKKSAGKAIKKYNKMSAQKDFSWWDLGAKFLPLLLKGGAMLTGLGDYNVKTNSLIAEASNGQNGVEAIPEIVNAKHTNIIRHREYVGRVLGATGDFTLISHRINPANDALFPWLSNIAHNYTRYRWRGLVFCFESLSANYAANTAMGYVAMATNYDSAEPVFSDKVSMLNYYFANERKPSTSFIHAVECAPDQNTVTEFYVRNTIVQPTGTDIRLYDIGQFQLAVGGNPVANGYLGDLWVSYEIEFFQEKMPSVLGVNLEAAFVSSSDVVVAATPFGFTRTIDPASTLHIATTATTLTIKPNQAKYLQVSVEWVGTVAGVIAFPTPTFTNCTPAYFSGAASGFIPSPGATSSRMAWIFLLTITSPETDATFQLDTAGVYPTSGTIVNICVTQISKFSFQSLTGTLKTDKFNATRVMDASSAKAVEDFLIQEKKNKLEVQAFEGIVMPKLPDVPTPEEQHSNVDYGPISDDLFVVPCKEVYDLWKFNVPYNYRENIANTATTSTDLTITYKNGRKCYFYYEPNPKHPRGDCITEEFENFKKRIFEENAYVPKFDVSKHFICEMGPMKNKVFFLHPDGRLRVLHADGVSMSVDDS